MESSKQISISPKYRKLDRKFKEYKIPDIKVNVKIKKPRTNPVLEHSNSAVFKLDDGNRSKNYSEYQFPQKKISKKLKISDITFDKDFDENYFKEIIFKPTPDVKPEELNEENFKIDSKIGKPTAKSQQTSLQRQVNYIQISEDFLEFNNGNEKHLFPPLSVPANLKTRKMYQKNFNSGFYEKIDRQMLGDDKSQARKLEKILKSNSQSPEPKIPKYIRHESFRAGYYSSKIDNFLRKLRIRQSKSPSNNIGKNNLKLNLF